MTDSTGPLSFPPGVFARLEPEVYLKRHLELGLRPGGLRKLDEFRPLLVEHGGGTKSFLGNGTLGSSVVRAGEATAVCAVVGGLTETQGGGGVYPNVEVFRGTRSGPPTEEEMILSRRAFELLQAWGIDHANFRIDGTETEVVLNLSVQVLSRTGPPFDLVWNSIVAALRDTRLPHFELDVDTCEVLALRDREGRPLALPERAVASTFGVVATSASTDTAAASLAIVADVDGVTEEQCIPSRIQVVSRPDALMTGFSLAVVGGASSALDRVKLSKSAIDRAVSMSIDRAASVDL